jgi:hypothetical protein
VGQMKKIKKYREIREGFIVIKAMANRTVWREVQINHRHVLNLMWLICRATNQKRRLKAKNSRFGIF